MTRILFACIGNSCRSQMAEAFCRELGREVECASAGTAPATHVQNGTVAAMQEVGIDISNAWPKGFDDLGGQEFDYLVTMGCEVQCPFIPGVKRVEWQIPDPYGKDLNEYRRVRDLIRRQVHELLGSLNLLKRSPRDNHQPLG
jgi:protein-tyrosine-phosphatase